MIEKICEYQRRCVQSAFIGPFLYNRLIERNARKYILCFLFYQTACLFWLKINILSYSHSLDLESTVWYMNVFNDTRRRHTPPTPGHATSKAHYSQHVPGPGGLRLYRVTCSRVHDPGCACVCLQPCVSVRARVSSSPQPSLYIIGLHVNGWVELISVLVYTTRQT